MGLRLTTAALAAQLEWRVTTAADAVAFVAVSLPSATRHVANTRKDA